MLSDVHRAYLNAHAVTDEVLEAAGVRSDGDFIVFPWRDGGLATEQRRLWPEPEGGMPEDVPKYTWEPGKHLHLACWREGADGSPVIIAEGTKQSLAVASWAPPECAVYGMAGCDGWRRLELAGLHRFAGRQVIIMLDADAGGNLNVWEAGEGLAAELELEDAVPGFVPSPAWGTDGIDDYLAKFPPERRADRVKKLLAKAGPKPAKAKPARRKQGGQAPEGSGLPQVIVNKQRREVVHEIIGHMQRLWNGTQLFCYGGALTRLRDGVTEPFLERGPFLRWMIEAADFYRYRPASATGPASYDPALPEQAVIEALLASGDEFAPLARVSRTPFARPDGTICFKNGYDFDPETGAGTRTMLITGNSGMDRLDIPDSPSREEAQAAASFLLGTWLGDMPWRDEASRANALALILTPFIRGSVPLVPVAVISGLQPGVGKNLLADCISLMASGETLQTLPWIPDDDDEMRKQITAVFRDGSWLACFDEAHVLGGAALTRALTSLTYADRILGQSKKVSYPNQMTWLALGNQVQVLADMARRAYYIELYPDCPDPQDRPESAFSIPDLPGWTLENRPELVTAALTLIRAWHAAGCPAFPRDGSMGSFQQWDKMMSGILGWAQVPGFLGNLRERRAERDTTGGYWTEHLAWLRGQFGSEPFTAVQVRGKALSSAGSWDAPPLLDEPEAKGFTRNLGAAYDRNQGRWFGTLRIDKAGTGHGTKVLWQVSWREPPDSELKTLPDLGGMDQGWILHTEGGSDGSDGSDGSFIPITRAREKNALSYPPVHKNLLSSLKGDGGHPSDPSHPSGPPVFVSDIETGDSGQLFTYPERGSYVRLAGILGPSGKPQAITVSDLLVMLDAAGEIAGHNFLGFDLLALAWHDGADWDSLAPKVRDTELIARQADPPRSRESGSSADRYGLDAVAERLGLPGKTDELKRLKAKHGGYDKIPQDDPEYLAYLEGDLRATRAVAAQLLPHYAADPYLRREHELAVLAGTMTLSGFAVDRELLERRYAEGEERKRDALQLIHDGWGLPLAKTVQKGRGKARHDEQVILDSPLAADSGRAWLEGIWERYQVPDPPRTAKTGKLALGAEDLKPVLGDPRTPDDLRSLLRLMSIVTGTRTVYQTALDNLCEDGRVHPRVSFRQASGRWSVTNPGLTVFGKRGGRHAERDIFIPDPGHVLLSFDLSQVDMRAMAGHSQDPGYMALFEPGRDAHAEIAAQVGVTRQDAKAIGHGWNYGLGPKRMIRNGLDEGKVYAFVRGMEERFPVLIQWREQIREQGKAGEILYNGFGRRMRCDQERAYTVAPALMGQGGARDIMCESLLRLPESAWPMLRVMVHDEIVLSVPKEIAGDVAVTVKAAMTWEWRGVPVLCDMAAGMSWGECSAK